MSTTTNKEPGTFDTYLTNEGEHVELAHEALLQCRGTRCSAVGVMEVVEMLAKQWGVALTSEACASLRAEIEVNIAFFVKR